MRALLSLHVEDEIHAPIEVGQSGRRQPLIIYVVKERNLRCDCP